MKVTKKWLENKIETLNNWLMENSKGIHFEYAPNKQKRDYYVNKLLELQEKNIEKIAI